MVKKFVISLMLSVCLLSIFVGCDLLNLSNGGNSSESGEEEEEDSIPQVYLNETLTNKDGIQFKVTAVLNR